MKIVISILVYILFTILTTAISYSLAKKRIPRGKRNEKRERNTNLKSQWGRNTKHLCFFGWYICAYCGKPIKWGGMHAEHIVPHSLNGRDSSLNLVPACVRCNLRKSNKTRVSYYVLGFSYWYRFPITIFLYISLFIMALASIGYGVYVNYNLVALGLFTLLLVLISVLLVKYKVLKYFIGNGAILMLVYMGGLFSFYKYAIGVTGVPIYTLLIIGAVLSYTLNMWRFMFNLLPGSNF